MNMATRVDRPGIEGCVSKISSAVETLKEAAQSVNSSMNDLPNYWEGSAYDKARSTYEEEYQTLLTKTVPEAVENFNKYIEQCMTKIVELDQQLSGN